jgi:hypothetical protein
VQLAYKKRYISVFVGQESLLDYINDKPESVECGVGRGVCVRLCFGPGDGRGIVFQQQKDDRVSVIRYR